MANFEKDFFAALDQLEVDAKAVGLNLTSICKETGVSRATPGRWRREVPMTVQLLRQMQDVVVSYLKRHPETRNESYSLLILKAQRAAWPCAKDVS